MGRNERLRAQTCQRGLLGTPVAPLAAPAAKQLCFVPTELLACRPAAVLWPSSCGLGGSIQLIVLKTLCNDSVQHQVGSNMTEYAKAQMQTPSQGGGGRQVKPRTSQKASRQLSSAQSHEDSPQSGTQLVHKPYKGPAL